MSETFSRGQQMLSKLGIRLGSRNEINKSDNQLTDVEVPNTCKEHIMECSNDALNDSSLPCCSGAYAALSEAELSDPVDDSDEDPDFIHDFDLSDSSEASEIENPNKKKKAPGKNTTNSLNGVSPDETISQTAIKIKSRKRQAYPTDWKRNKSKISRNTGKAYLTQKKGNVVPERKIRPACGTKCQLKCSSIFTDEERQTIFNNYWALGDITKQRYFILQSMSEIHPKYRYSVNNNNEKQLRKPNNAFYLQINSNKKRVCKTYFTATLGISNRCIRTVIEKNKDGFVEEDLRGKHANQKKVPDEIKNDIRVHISQIPAIESHYIRAHSERKYIDGSKSIAELYRDYVNDCKKENKPFGNETMYSRIFNNEFNLAFFTPKKDQCSKCEAYKNATEEEMNEWKQNFEVHQEEKELSRQEKLNDKGNISSLHVVASFDLQAVLPTPRGEVSSFYYKSKLSTYNFTICEFKQKEIGQIHSYMWHEGEGKRGAIEIGSCLLYFLKEQAEKADSEDLEITMYSDNCCGQQKNKFIISLYLYATANFKIKSITHKFLVVGHTQNEGDSVHAIIEKNIKRSLKSGPIYIPGQYVTLVRTASKKAKPIRVMEMCADDFYDIKWLAECTAVNFNKNTEGESFKLTDICVIKTEKRMEDHFFYKTSFKQNELKSVNIKESKTRKSTLQLFKNINLRKAYNEPLLISKKKYEDLQSLVNSNLIPKCYANFYKSLKYSNS